RFRPSAQQLEGVELGVLRRPDDRTRMYRQSRLAPARLIERNPLAGDAGAAAARDAPRLPLVVFLSHRNEVAAGVLDRAARNPAQDAPFLDALDGGRSEEHTSELQSLRHLVCRLLLEKKK